MADQPIECRHVLGLYPRVEGGRILHERRTCLLCGASLLLIREPVPAPRPSQDTPHKG